MPTVPTYDQLQVTPNTKPLTPVSAPQFQNFAADNAQRQGQAMQQLGGELGRQAVEMQLDANHSIVTHAMNASVQHEQKLEIGDNGYAKLQGRDALDRPQKEALWDEYGTKLDKANADIAKKFLKNDAQRQAFKESTANRRTVFTTRIMRHAATEQKKYNLSVQKGTIEVANNRLALSGGDPEVVADSVTAIKGAVLELGRLQGKAKDEIAADMVDALSPGHAAVISSAVDSGRTNFAKQYLNAHNAELTPAARIALKKTIQTGDMIGQAQDKTDSIMASNKTPTEKISAARSIDDPKLRDHVVSRVKARVSEARTLEQQANNDHLQQAYDLIANRQEIPASLLSNIHGTNKLNLLKLQAQGGTPSRDNLTAYAGLKSLPADQLTIETVMKFAPFLTPNTMKKFIDMAANPSEQEKSLISNSARISNSIKALGLDAEKQGVLYKQIETWQQQLGHNPTHKELGDYLDFIQKEVLTEDRFIYDLHEKVANIRVDGVPTEQIPGIVKALAAANKPTSDANILKVFERLSTQ